MNKDKKYLCKIQKKIKKNNLHLIIPMVQDRNKQIYIKIVPMDQQNQYYRDIMEQYLLMVKQEQGKHIQWKDKKQKSRKE